MFILIGKMFALSGYLPEMALHIDGPSRKVGELVKDKQLINWEKEISESQARRLLQKKFYPFQEVLIDII